MPTVKVFSHTIFDKYCKDNKITDDNVETEHNGTAFISIICTEGVRKYYLQEDEQHWFKQNHPNVLNLEFDDVTHDHDLGEYIAHTITDEQARQIVEFIEANKDKDIICHCRCGYSRSFAIGFWVKNHVPEYKDCDLGDYGRPNGEVLRKLNHILWAKDFDEKKYEIK